jgi:5'-nucleotidase
MTNSIDTSIRRPLILVTNDDGICHPGLWAACSAAADLGDVIVAAPSREQSSTGRSYPRGPTVGRIVAVEPAKMGSAAEICAYSIDASPAQCVAYAVLELCARKPSLCIAGINFGANVGMTLTGSGTLGAAFEADCFGIPSIAISVQTLDGDAASAVDWQPAASFMKRLGTVVLRDGLPGGVSILNVNVPAGATANTQVKRTRDSRQPYWEFLQPARTVFDTGLELSVTSHIDRSSLEPDSDIQCCIIEGNISVTPLRNTLAYEGPWTFLVK